jgi:hypothetical protein
MARFLKGMNKIQIITKIEVIAFALMVSFASKIVVDNFTSITASHVTITKLLVESMPPVNTTKPQDNSNTAIVQEVNDTRTYVFTTVSRANVGLTAWGIFGNVVPSPLWAILQIVFDTMRDVKEELYLFLICAFCILKPSKLKTINHFLIRTL